MTERLLLVDDDDIFREVLARALHKRGYAVTPAADVDSALAAAAAGSPFDYAIVDLRMPGASGLTLVEKLAAMYPAVRIVVLTGYASIATAVEAIKLGAVHYLTKPAAADEIVAAFSRQRGDATAAPACVPPSIERLEWEHIQRVLVESEGNISEAARRLGMHRRTLQRKLHKRPVRR